PRLEEKLDQALAKAVEAGRQQPGDELGRVGRELDGRQEDSFLRPEVVGDQSGVDTRDSRDLADCRPFIADLAEMGASGAEDLVPRSTRTRAASSSRHGR